MDYSGGIRKPREVKKKLFPPEEKVSEQNKTTESVFLLMHNIHEKIFARIRLKSIEFFLGGFPQKEKKALALAKRENSLQSSIF